MSGRCESSLIIVLSTLLFFSACSKNFNSEDQAGDVYDEIARLPQYTMYDPSEAEKYEEIEFVIEGNHILGGDEDHLIDAIVLNSFADTTDIYTCSESIIVDEEPFTPSSWVLDGVELDNSTGVEIRNYHCGETDGIQVEVFPDGASNCYIDGQPTLFNYLYGSPAITSDGDTIRLNTAEEILPNISYANEIGNGELEDYLYRLGYDTSLDGSLLRLTIPNTDDLMANFDTVLILRQMIDGMPVFSEIPMVDNYSYKIGDNSFSGFMNSDIGGVCYINQDTTIYSKGSGNLIRIQEAYSDLMVLPFEECFPAALEAIWRYNHDFSISVVEAGFIPTEVWVSIDSTEIYLFPVWAVFFSAPNDVGISTAHTCVINATNGDVLYVA